MTSAERSDRRVRVITWTIVVALLVAATVAVAALPLMTAAFDRFARRDVELRARLVNASVRDRVDELLRKDDTEALNTLFQRLSDDERLVAAGYCDPARGLRFASKEAPPALTCSALPAEGEDAFTTVHRGDRDMLISGFTLPSQPGRIVLLHDMRFSVERSNVIRSYVLVALAAVALGGAALAALIGFIAVRRWLAALRRAIDDLRAGRIEAKPGVDLLGVGQEIQNALDELDFLRRGIDVTHTEWTPDTLSVALANELPGAEVIVVSNREPYIHNRTENGIQLQIPASGLVSALEPVTRACRGTWIAHGSGSADRDVVDANDRVAVPPNAPTYTLRRVWLSEEEQDGYYYGFANEGLWPLCHIAFVRPIFRESDWLMYRQVNERFADAVVAEAKTPDPIVLVQDYHFALLPRLVRERLPNATIVTFWHIPWPNSETFGICPYRDEIIEGLLGSSILGFHTRFHCNNLFDTVDRFLESRIDRERASITFGGHETVVRPYPISIEWPPAAMAGQAPVPEARQSVRQRLGLKPDVALGIGIERFDYTKGITDRMMAVDQFLTDNPDWRGRFSFVQVAAPTRSKLPSYKQIQDEATAMAEDINARHEVDGVKPIVLLARHHEPAEVFELFRAADLCIVSSLHDGMNLVAKEFVAARDDEEGVLVLSAFAGASRELNEALIVNPYHTHAMAAAIQRALSMPPSEQRERMRLMREQVRARNVYRWAGQMLIDAARLRKRQRVAQIGETSGDANA
jgi:trehalose 6-phosphate synthase